MLPQTNEEAWAYSAQLREQMQNHPVDSKKYKDLWFEAEEVVNLINWGWYGKPEF